MKIFRFTGRGRNNFRHDNIFASAGSPMARMVNSKNSRQIKRQRDQKRRMKEAGLASDW